MGPSSAADAALFLEMVCGTVALVRCLRRFVVSMGPGSAALLQHFFLDGGVLDLVFAFCWFHSIGPAVPAAPLFFEIVCCNIARPGACVWFRSFPPCQFFGSLCCSWSMRMAVCFTVSHLT